MLRNLTSKQFVQMALNSDGLGPTVVVKGKGRVDLDELLVKHICWTRPSAAPSPRRRGRWAGHAFDGVHESDLERKEGWQDITPVIVGVSEDDLDKELACGMQQEGTPSS